MAEHAPLRQILGLAVPALGVLAAEPLYLLVDTAVVGHLGAVPLGGLSVANGRVYIGTFDSVLYSFGLSSR